MPTEAAQQLAHLSTADQKSCRDVRLGKECAGEKEYRVVELPPDDRSIPFTPVVHPLWQPLALVIFLLQFWLATLHWRAKSAVGPWPAFLLVLAHMSTLVGKLVEDGWRFLCPRVRPRSRLRLRGNHVPRVDVVITTCGESIDIILDTVKSACAQDYSASSFRVLVSDDGQDEQLRQEIHKLGQSTKCGLLYYARPGKKGSKKGFKGGNMNAAIAFLDSLGESAEYVGFTDADMIMSHDWLQACVAHLVVSPRAGIAVVPQKFYNLPPNDSLGQSLNTQARRDNVQRDSMGAASNTGPGAVMRRVALDQAGGVPENIVEDIFTGFLMNGAGWQVIYCREELQWGLVPDTFRGHTGQRAKWTIGSLRIAAPLSFGFSRTRLPKSTLPQRVVALLCCITPLVVSSTRFVRLWIVTILGLTTRILVLPISPTDAEQIAWISWLLVLGTHLEDILVGREAGFWALMRRKQANIWLSPYFVLGVVRELMPTWMAGLRIDATPTSMLDSTVQERDRKLRAPLARRVVAMIMCQGLWYHVLCIAVLALVLGKAAVDVRALSGTIARQDALLRIACAVGTDWELWVHMLAPIAYAVWPPDMPHRRELLYRDGDAGQAFEMWRPKPERTVQRFSWWILLLELPPLLTIALWTYACFWRGGAAVMSGV